MRKIDSYNYCHFLYNDYHPLKVSTHFAACKMDHFMTFCKQSVDSYRHLKLNVV